MCDFCDIANKRLSAHMIYENENIMAFLDYEPVSEGHILICPKEHVDSLDKISEKSLSDIIRLSKNLIKTFGELYGTDSYSFIQNGGKCCDYGHAHFHIFPRFENDGFDWSYPAGAPEYSEDVAKKIRVKLDEI